VRNGVNGVVLGNTFPTAQISALPMCSNYDDLIALRADGNKGGLSGRPLYENMFWTVSYVKKHYPSISIMACGGIDHGNKIYDLLKLGVDAIQCYSVVAFRWMAAHAMRKELQEVLIANGYKNLSEFYGE